MFSKRQMTILDWFVFFVLMIIPIVNIIVIILLLISPSTNLSLKNFILFWLIITILSVVLGIRFILSFIQNFPAFN